jgi:hypothetical protein
MINLLITLVSTLIVEILFLEIVTSSDNRINGRKIFLVTVAANLITNPLANIIVYFNRMHDFLNLIPTSKLILLLELVAVGVEAYLFRRYLVVSAKKACLLSLGANLASIILGYVVFMFISIPFGLW